jgi:hypothetical protein
VETTVRRRRFPGAGWSFLLLAAVFTRCFAQAPHPEVPGFASDVQPLLREYCHDCHGDGARKGNVTLDAFTDEARATIDPQLWWQVLKNVRAGLMPPPKKPQPSAEQKERLERWIKSVVFRANPADPDPGRVTLRRLNRVEYRNTIRDLLGIDFDTTQAFPPDDAGHGFDTLGEVLTLSPMLLEKYLAAAQTVVSRAVPAQSRIPAEHVLAGASFLPASATTNAVPAPTASTSSLPAPGALNLSYYSPATVTQRFTAPHAGRYRLVIDGAANERFVDNQFDYHRCRFLFRVDGEELHGQEFARENGRILRFEFERDWSAGGHELTLEVVPLTPDEKQVRSLTLRVDSVTVAGPLAPEHWVKPPHYDRFFPREVPSGAAERHQYAGEILRGFLHRAHRGPVDPIALNRLVELAEATYQAPGKTFEAGLRQAFTAILASPRFLFREEGIESADAGQPHPRLDEYALATRLAYFLWSSTPDDELLRLAGEHRLREQLPAQTRRLLQDGRSEALGRNFVGQWLQTRDVESINIDARQVFRREQPVNLEQERQGQRFRELNGKPEAQQTAEEKAEINELRNAFRRRPNPTPRTELTPDLRRALRLETELTFAHIVREDRPLLELLDNDYTFLNEKLARHYGLTNLGVIGDELRRVSLPPGGPRGGVLTHGSVLMVTSNPTRTSPVKRGLFVLENLLGTPPPPPPPDITPLEDAAKGIKDRAVSLRETLALHREQASCSSCHNRMDPLGLALENFNALGLWRDEERGLPIDASGTLLSGERFTHVAELRRLLATRHAPEFYHALTEKLLTYALGRGLEYTDVVTVDRIVERLQASGGRPSVLFGEILASAPFQRTRAVPASPAQTLPPTPAPSLSPAPAPAQPSAANPNSPAPVASRAGPVTSP